MGVPALADAPARIGHRARCLPGDLNERLRAASSSSGGDRKLVRPVCQLTPDRQTQPQGQDPSRSIVVGGGAQKCSLDDLVLPV
jgi:hypothetical protein